MNKNTAKAIRRKAMIQSRTTDATDKREWAEYNPTIENPTARHTRAFRNDLTEFKAARMITRKAPKRKADKTELYKWTKPKGGSIWKNTGYAKPFSKAVAKSHKEL